MNWPLPQDFNEAVQNPATAFADPELKGGQTVVGPTGLPLPRSGNFADVYQIRAADGRFRAMKCFTRPVTGLESRYKKVDDALDKAGLPFTVGFTFLTEGVMVRGEWYPSVKMEWVDGLQVNQVVRDQTNNPKVLDALGQMWSRLCKRLRDAGIAHADLQHGNVLLVPGSKPGAYGLKLIDYDGMYVKSLANTPSGESGHPNYQHPQRAVKQVYSPDLDRFPHLVFATAFKALAILGPTLWEKYDTGDNLLFVEDDFKAPVDSKLLKELWQTNNPGLKALVGHLAISCGKPIPQTPWLDQIAPDGIVVPLSPEQLKAATAALGLAPPAPKAVAPVDAEEYGVELVAVPSAPVEVESVFATVDRDDKPRGKKKSREEAKGMSPIVPIAIVAGLLVSLGGVIAGGIMMFGGKPDEVVHKDPDDKKDDKKDDTKGKPKPPDPTPKPPEKDPTPPDPVPKPPEKDPIIPPMPPGTAQRFNLDPAGVPDLALRWEGPTVGALHSARFTLNGEWLIACDSNTTPIRVYTAKTGTKALGFTEGMTNAVDFACLSDGNVVSWHTDQPFAIVWNPGTGKAVGKIPVRTPGFAAGQKLFDASPDGRYIAIGHAAANNAKDPTDVGKVSVFDTQENKEVLKLELRGPKFQFTKAGELFVPDLSLTKIYQLPSGKETKALFIPGDWRGKMLAGSPDGKFALHPGKGRDLRLLDCTRGNFHAALPNGALPNRFFESAGAFSNDGRLLAVCSFPVKNEGINSSHVEIIDLEAGRVVGRFPLNTPSLDVHCLAFAPDNSMVAVGRNRKVQVFDLPKNLVAVIPKKDPDPAPAGGVKQLWSIPVQDVGFPAKLEFTPDESTLGFVYGNRIQGANSVFAIPDGAALPSLNQKNTLGLMQFDSGRFGTYSPKEKAVTVWDPKTGAALPKIELPNVKNLDGKELVVLSPNEKYLVVGNRADQGSDDAGLKSFGVFDAASGKSLLSTEWVGQSVHFTDDSSRLLVVEATGRCRWYRLPTGTKDAEFKLWDDTPKHQIGAGQVFAISSDGAKILASCYLDNQVLERGIHLVEGRTGKNLRNIYNRGAFDVSMSPDARMFAIHHFVPQTGKGDEGHYIYIMDLARPNGAHIIRVSKEIRFTASAISYSGRYLAFYSAVEGKLTLYELPGAGAVAVVPKKKDPDPIVVPMPKDPPPVPKLDRKPMPEKDAIAKAETKLRGLLKDDYAKKLATERRAFALKLLGLTDESADDPATRYVMFRDARDLAIDVSDLTIAMQAVEGIIRIFDVDANQVKLETYDKIKDVTISTTALREVAALAIASSDVAAAADDYPTAVKFAQSAIAAAKKGNLPVAILEDAEAQLLKAQKSAEMFEPVKAAIERLKKDPEDGDAAFVVGRYRCFTQGRWDDGIKPLAKGASAALKAAAEMDAAAPRTGPADVKLAEAWWAAAQAAPDLDKRAVEYRARFWYARALPDLKGDDKDQAENRIGFTAGGVDYRTGLLAEFTAKVPAVLQGKKARIDPILSFSAAEFKAEGVGVATDITVRWSGFLAPQRPGRYRIIAAATDPVVVRIDGKSVIDTNSKTARRDVLLSLPDKPTAITVEFKCLNTDRHTLKLLWSIPGTDVEEPIPPEALFHDRKTETVLGKGP